MKRILIIDLNSSIHQVPGFMAKLKTSKGKPTGHIISFLKKLSSYKKFNPLATIFCVDTGRSGRTKIDPTYKGNRKTKQSKIKDVLPLLLHMPVIVCYKRGYEADDIVFSCASNLKDYFEVLVIAKDYDLSYVLKLGSNVRHFMTSNHEVLKTELFLKFGCTPNLLPLYKAVFGDSSDNIKAIKIKNKRKIEGMFVAQEKIKDIIKSVDKNIRPKLLNNIKLTKPKCVRDFKVIVGKTNIDKIKMFLADNEIESITPEDLVNYGNEKVLKIKGLNA